MPTHLWSGAQPPPPPGGWFDGRGFWLNELAGEEVYGDDERLTVEEREDVERQSAVDEDHCVTIELSLGDPRCRLSDCANRAALPLAALNHDPEGLRSALLTTFDMAEDVQWLRSELKLSENVPLTLAMHPWPGKQERRTAMNQALVQSFYDVVVHFPSCAWNEGSSVHSKLLLFEFEDRLRVAITSANLRPEHWKYKNEVVWVQDFPRLTDVGVAPDLARLLSPGRRFGRTLAQHVAELLQGARGERQSTWAEVIAAFDFEAAAAVLITSCPGLAMPVAAGALGLRLRARPPQPPAQPQQPQQWSVGSWDAGAAKAEGSDAAPSWPSRARLAPRLCGGAWELRRLPDAGDEPAVGPLRALARHCLGYWREAVSWLSGADRLALLDEASSDALSVAVELGLQPPEVVDVEVSYEQDPWGSQYPSFVVRVPLPVATAAPMRPCWHPRAALLLARLEDNFGLFAMQSALSHEAWPLREERHYVAMTCAVQLHGEAWLAALDDLVCRGAAERPGPDVVAPGSGPLEAVYEKLHQQGRLVDHVTPAYCFGRDLVPNHSKVLVRQFLHEECGAPYGWIYVGSHNFTQSAWGKRVHGEQPRLWISNRELGVLLLQPRSEAHLGDGSLFARTPLPFLVPLEPADLRGREVMEEPEWDTWRWDQPWGTDWNWYSGTGWDAGGWSDDDDSDVEDWRLSRRSTQWWTWW